MCPYFHVDNLHCEQELMRDALALLKEQERIKLFNEHEYLVKYTGDALQLLPDVMQEIVRCKDCKFKQDSSVAGRTWWCNRLEKFCDNDWFCADGERKVGEVNERTCLQMDHRL